MDASNITLNNLKKYVFGFLNYVKDVLNDASYGLEFAPFLHKNSNKIQSKISSYQNTNRDTSLLL